MMYLSISNNHAIVVLTEHLGRVDDGGLLDDAKVDSILPQVWGLVIESDVVVVKGDISPIAHRADSLPVGCSIRTTCLGPGCDSDGLGPVHIYIQPDDIRTFSIVADVVLLVNVDDPFLVVGLAEDWGEDEQQ